MIDRVFRGLDRDFLPFDADLSAVDLVRAEDRAHRLGTACADKARKAQDLPAVCLEAHVIEDARLRDMLDLQHRLLRARSEFLRELVVERTADHRLDQRVVVPVLDVARLDELAVADDRHAVAELEQLFQLVGDEDNADPAALQVPAGLHQLLDFLLRQRGRRLVHDDALRVHQHRLRDLDHLLDAHAVGARCLVHVHVLAQILHDLRRALMHRAVVQQRALFEPLIDVDVVCDIQELLDVQLLVNAGDACLDRFLGGVEMHFLPVHDDLPLVRLMYARQGLDQRRLARAVLSDQAEDLTRLYVEVHLVERDDTRKCLTDILQFYNILTHSIPPFL